MWWDALTQEYLSIELTVAKGVRARIIERPGRWMGAEELANLVSDLRLVATKTLENEPLEYGVLTGDQERLDNAILTVLYDTETTKPIAFNALSNMDISLHGAKISVVHLGLVMVAPEARSKGLSWVLYTLTCLLVFARNQLRPIWFSNVSQVPAVIGMTSESFSDVFPTPLPNARRSFDHLLIAREIMSHHRHVFGVGPDASFNEEQFVIENAYTGGSDNLKKTFEEAPKSRDEIYNTFCSEQLDYAQGDDFLQLGRLDMTTAQDISVKNIPRKSILYVGAALAVVSLNRVILPLLYWFSSDRQWGVLRPNTCAEVNP